MPCPPYRIGRFVFDPAEAGVVPASDLLLPFPPLGCRLIIFLLVYSLQLLQPLFFILFPVVSEPVWPPYRAFCLIRNPQPLLVIQF
ncbi:uncharacterized protein BO97DRAFT_99951 [Aspergillus homomorphus CBS 101889]|uniref:Uncharacterized protein n=1 Tax=Aspergillus homomorphus (strain CBS 101889) TaxID=1450537 RepID=A0A395HV53_ASPHC|nr:hypothetical protein BO97DRAFT_99951 [Aspergillus homomorphus CBS 101889]RAL11283.1 hypothetical protein BO97DRAFT_99951 [Aspergillus homomorphus CBS 101889]